MEQLLILFKIILINIILSGDNAVVIAMATRSLPDKIQNKAMIWGTAFAVIARLLLAVIVVKLMEFPYVHAIGGFILVYIAWGVLNQSDSEKNINSHESILKAVLTIGIADLTMSLDNVLAVAGAAGGHAWLLITGIALSIPLMVFGSKILVHLMEKYPVVVYIGAGILAWTAGEMITGDERLARLFPGAVGYFFNALLAVLLITTGFFKNKKH